MQRGIQGPERRQLTVLFSDMVGFSALSSRLDPEDLRVVLRTYQRVCTSEIERFGGLVTRYVGDGIIALFGFPRAHEDDPERATNAGLAIVDRIRSADVRLETQTEVRLAVRVGIATGLVVAGDLIGEGVSEEAAVVGETPNLAARLQQLADPNSVVLHDGTKNLAGAGFEYKHLGPQVLAGFSEPVEAWQVLSRRTGRSRFEAAHPTNLSPLIGRERELQGLSDLWKLAAQGQGQVVLLTGEAGVGKSRIAQTLDEQIESSEHERVRFQCSSYHPDSALHPFIEQLEWAAGLAGSETGAEKLGRLERLVTSSGLELAAAMPILLRLLSLPDDRRYPLGAISSPQIKERTLSLLEDRLRQAARRNPLLVIFEDVQWADPTSLELIERLVESAHSERILLIISYRPNPKFTPSWKGASGAVEMELERLHPDDAARLAKSVAMGAISTSTVEQIVARSDGVPLFIEEVTRAVSSGRHSADQALPWDHLAVPWTIQNTLEARLDQAGDAKWIAQAGAAIGRSFSHELLAAVAETAENSLDEGLRRLVDTGLLYQEGRPPQAIYSFKHALVQDAAEKSLLRSKRRELHGRIADVLVSRFRELADTQPEVVARHYFEARRFGESAKCWLDAAGTAIQRSANKEAVAHLRQALEALGEVHDDRAAAELELPIQLSLGVALTQSEGFASPRVEAAYARARALCAAAGDTPETFYALCGLGSFYTVRAQLATARDVAGRMLELGQSNADDASLLWGHAALGVTELYAGEFESAKRHLEDGAGVYDPQRHGGHGFLFGQDAGIIAWCHRAWSACFTGEPEEASGHIAFAIQLAGKLSHAFSQAYALTFAAWLEQFLGKPAECRKWADAAISSAKEQEFPLLLGMAMVAKGWAVAMEGDARTGAASIEQGIALYEATGAELGRPAMLGLLALATAQSGDLKKGVEIAGQALELAVGTGQLLFKAELHRLIAELMLQSAAYVEGPAREEARRIAKDSAQAALETAAGQGARALVLRAALTNLRTATSPEESARGAAELVKARSAFRTDSALPEYQLARQLLEQSGLH